MDSILALVEAIIRMNEEHEQLGQCEAAFPSHYRFPPLLAEISADLCAPNLRN
jgi:hypothetical protein